MTDVKALGEARIDTELKKVEDERRPRIVALRCPKCHARLRRAVLISIECDAADRSIKSRAGLCKKDVAIKGVDWGESRIFCPTCGWNHAKDVARRRCETCIDGKPVWNDRDLNWGSSVEPDHWTCSNSRKGDCGPYTYRNWRSKDPNEPMALESVVEYDRPVPPM